MMSSDILLGEREIQSGLILSLPNSPHQRFQHLVGTFVANSGIGHAIEPQFEIVPIDVAIAAHVQGNPALDQRLSVVHGANDASIGSREDHHGLVARIKPLAVLAE